ncbi:MAG: hypothetical protein B9S34_07760 [Opitutia bacterium Tous-C1TDCM]|nr:MAG: hypothetical protein B9S34_07760 [Opitutae bacterium Tous-C1TDCM]
MSHFRPILLALVFLLMPTFRLRPVAALVVALLSALATPLAGAPVLNELMARPGTGYPEDPALEFIEIHNPDTTAASLAGWALTQGVDFVFPAGTSIPAGGYLVVAANPAALRAAAPALAAAAVVGPWRSGATLANRGETVTLANAAGTVVDRVDYADEGDWAVRTRDALGGWSWVSPAFDAGRSLERRNPRLAVAHAHNWGPSAAAGGTPGAANSLLAANLAPVISGVSHQPAVPNSTEAVTISARLRDESAASALAATLHWRDATSASPGAFQTVAMNHVGDGIFTAGLAALPDRTVVEYYISATDGALARTWPAPSNEGQNTNAVYQVDNEVVAGPAAVYRFVLTGSENAAFAAYTATVAGPGGGGPGGGIGDRRFNFTLVATRGADATVRHLASMRVRGNSSRNYAIKPLRISLPSDDRWGGVSDFIIGTHGAPVQLLAHRIQRAAGLVTGDATPIEVRRNGVKATVAVGNTADHGQLMRIEELDGDFLDNHFPLAASAQLYRKVAISNWAYTSAAAPANPDLTWSGWSKQNNGAANDWSDVMAFTKVWQDTLAGYFTGAAAGNVAAGTWNGTPVSAADYAKLAEVADLDYLARWLAVMTVIPNAEENLSTGEDDDYAAAFVGDGTRTRMYPLPHDMDTTFGLGEVAVSATAKGLYDSTEIGPRTGNFADTQMEPLLPLLGDSTRPGHAAFREKYLTTIRELFGSVFDADTSTNANPPFYQFVDNHLGWTPASYRQQIKSFMTARQTHLLGLIGAAKIAPAAATSTATAAAASAPTLRLNEVLAANTRLANGTAFPDLIELHNAGPAEISLTGKSLTDDPAEPRKYVFPANTVIPAGGFLVVSATAGSVATGLNTGFALDAEGDTVRLYDSPGNNGVLLDSVAFGFQIPDFSISRTGADATTWALTAPTAGAANGNAVALAPPSGLRLNEWAAHVEFRLDHDLIELHNPAAQPVALAGLRLSDDFARPNRFVFPGLSFIAPSGFLPLYGADFGFGLDGDFDFIFLAGENGAAIDAVDLVSQPFDTSTGRSPDGGPAYASFDIPTPGIANTTALPAALSALLAQLRITEVMYNPTGGNDYEFVEVQNIGSSALDLGGVRFTNGLDYTFPAGTSLAPGAYTVVARNRTAFLSRYPAAAASLAPGTFSGTLDNNGENIALTLPEPWYVHIVRFRYESTWQPLTAGNGFALSVRSPAATAVRALSTASSWRASAAANGSPGSADSSTVTIAALAGPAVTATAGSSATIGVRVSANGPVSYQWQQLVNGTWINLTGATAATYTVASAQAFNSGSYRVLVTADGSTLTSDTTVLTVVGATGTNSSRLVNISTRAQSLTGSNAVVPGFVVAGSASKRLLIRAVGPTLGAFGVSGVLADPNLTLQRYNSATATYSTVAANDNWAAATNAATVTTTTAAVGGFALGATAADAALLVDLAPGQYTAAVGAPNDGTGVALVELYDADAGTPVSRLANLATRAFVGTGDAAVAAGFVISGSGTKTLLVRAVGPTLGGFGVTGSLADPQLALFSGAQSILANDDWSTGPGAATTATVAAQVGAFALPTGSKDAAFVVTLPAGAYTVQVNGANSTTGVALVEVYEVP